MEMPDNNFDEFDRERLPYRRDLLPWWIKFFSFLFIILGGFAVINMIMLLFGKGEYATIYGLEYVIPEPFGTPVILLLIIVNGLTGYLLLFEEDHAIIMGQICGVAGIVACLIATAATIKAGHMVFRFEILLFIPFLAKLSTLKEVWKYESRSH